MNTQDALSDKYPASGFAVGLPGNTELSGTALTPNTYLARLVPNAAKPPSYGSS